MVVLIVVPRHDSAKDLRRQEEDEEFFKLLLADDYQKGTREDVRGRKRGKDEILVVLRDFDLKKDATDYDVLFVHR